MAKSMCWACGHKTYRKQEVATEGKTTVALNAEAEWPILHGEESIPCTVHSTHTHIKFTYRQRVTVDMFIISTSIDEGLETGV